MWFMCGGANNIVKNESSKGLKYMTHFVQSRRNRYVMITSTPHRFNLEVSSCVNKEVKVLNRKLQKIMKMFNHTDVISMSSNREHFTNHGLHMNGMGKEWFTNGIADAIKKIFAYRKSVSVRLNWKEKSVERSQLEKGDKVTPNQSSKT